VTKHYLQFSASASLIYHHWKTALPEELLKNIKY